MTIRVRALGEEEAAELGCMARSRTVGAGLVRRAQIIQHAVDGLSAPGIAAKMGLCGATVRFWLKRFNERGLSGLEEDVNRRGTGPPIGIQSGPLYGGRDRFVPVANGRAPRASRSAFTSDAAAGAGGTCLPTGASRGGTAFQLRFLKRQLSLPVSMMSQ